MEEKDKFRKIINGLEGILPDREEESKLTEFWNDLTGGFNFETLDDRFNAISHALMNYLCLSVANETYRITEIEIYYYDEVNHPDPYVHCADEQLNVGMWYFNGAGLDITFGDAEKRIYGGILIRGIMKFGSEYYINGPSNVLKEIFTNFGNILFDEGGFSLVELDQDAINRIEMEPIRSSRIGLTKKNDDNENYFEKDYRFLVDLNIHHKFKDKEKVVRQLLVDNEVTNEKATEILGYKINV